MKTLTFEVNGARLRFDLDNAVHVWWVFKDSMEQPLLRLTKAKGDAVIKLLDLLKGDVE